MEKKKPHKLFLPLQPGSRGWWELCGEKPRLSHTLCNISWRKEITSNYFNIPLGTAVHCTSPLSPGSHQVWQRPPRNRLNCSVPHLIPDLPRLLLENNTACWYNSVFIYSQNRSWLKGLSFFLIWKCWVLGLDSRSETLFPVKQYMNLQLLSSLSCVLDALMSADRKQFALWHTTVRIITQIRAIGPVCASIRHRLCVRCARLCKGGRAAAAHKLQLVQQLTCCLGDQSAPQPVSLLSQLMTRQLLLIPFSFSFCFWEVFFFSPSPALFFLMSSVPASIKMSV